MIGTTELLMILAIAVLIFGTKRLRNIGEDLGAAIKGFKTGMKDGTASDKKVESLASEDASDKQIIEGEVKEKIKS